MIQIQHEQLTKFAQEHYEALKGKIEIPKHELQEILLATPDKLLEVAKKYERYNDKFQNKYNNFTSKKEEYDAYDLATKLQVNVCPYCNINPTYTVITKKGKKLTRPEFDHFYDKATYPVLSLSFYNLIPSCHTCNATLKGTEKFSDTTHLNPYSESFDNVAKFHLHIKDSTFYHKVEGFDIELDTQDERAKNNIKSFELKELYKNHKGIVLDLIQKQSIYNESYMDELLTQYEGTLFKNREDLQRLVSRGYISDEEIGKRPLSKLIKDISIELGLV